MIDRIHTTQYCTAYYGAESGLLYTCSLYKDKMSYKLDSPIATHTFVFQTRDPASWKNYFLNQFRHIGGEKQPIQCQPTL